jgi:hypothetical protein
MQPGHHGPERRFHNCGRLAVAKALNINQVENLAELFWQVLERRDQAVGRNLGKRCVLGGYRGCTWVGSIAHRQLLDRGNAQHGLALPLPVTVYESVQQDPMQPGPDICVRSEPMKRRARSGNGFLNQVFGVLAVLGELQRRTQQLSLVRQRIALEPLR